MAKGKYEYWLTDDGLTLLKGWARDGLTDKDIAKNCDISASTLYEWRKKYPEISESLKKGKEIIDTEVENALLKRALGFYCTETTVREYADGSKVKTTVTRYVPPDVTALIYWLKNRKPEQWRDRREPDNEKDNEKVNIIIDV